MSAIPSRFDSAETAREHPPIEHNHSMPSVRVSDLLLAVSTALDLMRPKLAMHQRRVAIFSASVGEAMGLSPQQQSQLVMAALIHDVGLAVGEGACGEEIRPGEDDLHALRGAAMLSASGMLSGLAPIIRTHHNSWASSRGVRFDGDPIPIESHILYLCDRIDHMMNPQKFILDQVDAITMSIEQGSGDEYEPDVVCAFLKAAQDEAFWLQTESSDDELILRRAIDGPSFVLTYEEMLDLATIFGVIVDSKSQFTETHSCGVAEVSEVLSELIGLEPEKIQLIKLAGHLHDLGKLAVPSEILEKNGPLTDDEMEIVRGHTYFTNAILKRIPGLGELASWGANHHEKLNGEGYPFGLSADQLSVESRIISVADRFVALTENRPYRGSLDVKAAMEIMWRFVETGDIDLEIVAVLDANLESINERRRLAQAEEHQFLSQVRRLRR